MRAGRVRRPIPGAHPSDLDETVGLVEEHGRRIVAVQADVRDREALEAAARPRGWPTLGRLDVVVANAGIGSIHRWDSVTPEIWQNTIDINLTGVWNTVMATAQHVIDSGGGSIILVSSAGGLKAMPFMIPYTASKFAVTGPGQGLRQGARRRRRQGQQPPPRRRRHRDGRRGVRRRRAVRRPPAAGGLVRERPADRRCSPAEAISHAVLYLASDESRYVTASALVVDAGTSAM